MDIACHEILGTFGVREILPPSGGSWGSCLIDEEYLKLLDTVFGREWMEQFEREQSTVFLEIRHHFQSAKSTFYRHKERKWHNVRLPVEFLNFLEEKIEDLALEKVSEIEDLVAAAKISGFSKLSSFVEILGWIFVEQ